MKTRKWIICLLTAMVLALGAGTVMTTTATYAAKKATVKVGKTFTSGKFRYKITSLKGKKGNVALVGVKSKSITSASIPKTVKTKGYTLTVNEIAGKAFKNCKKLKTVTTNTEIKTIGNNVFSGCKKLKKINIKSKKLKTVGKNALKGISANTKVTVVNPASVTAQKLLVSAGLEETKAETEKAKEKETTAAEPKKDSSAPETRKETSTTEARKETSTTEARKESTTTETRKETSAPETKKETVKETPAPTPETEKATEKATEKKTEPPHQHSYSEWKIVTDATCTTDGSKTRSCTGCGETETEVIKALGHAYASDYTIDKAATCTTAGEKSKHCSRCDAVTDRQTIPATGHKYST